MKKHLIWPKPSAGWPEADLAKGNGPAGRKILPVARLCLLALAFFLVWEGLELSRAQATQHYDLAREKAEKFVKAYLDVDRLLKGGTGKSRELKEAMEYANARLKHDEFTETWNNILEMECLPTAMDMRTKVKTDVEYDWIQRYISICYQKFILFHWDEVNGSIERRLEQVRSPEFLEGGRTRH